MRFFKPKAVVVPRQGDYAKYAPYRFDQDGQPICVPVADSEMLAYDAARMGMIPAGWPLYFSPWWGYNLGRLAHGGLSQNDGTYPEDVAQAICNLGVMPYTRWPCKRDEFGNILLDNTDPNTRIADAIKLPDMVPSRINNGVDGLLAALADGVVSIAVPWFDKWGSSYKSGPLPPITGEDMSGRHNIVIDGWDQDDGMFYGPNSWGDWGIQDSALGMRASRCGFKMPFEYIELFKSKFDGYDAWDIDFGFTESLPPMTFNLKVNAGFGSYGSGVYPAGCRVEVFAGRVANCDFNRWRPGLNMDNQWSARANITMVDDTDLQAYWLNKQPKRCRLFNIAKAKNMREGI